MVVKITNNKNVSILQIIRENIICCTCRWEICYWGWHYDVDCHCNFVNALISDFMKKKRDSKDCEEEVVEVVMETKFILATFHRFYDRGVILYFTTKLLWYHGLNNG